MNFLFRKTFLILMYYLLSSTFLFAQKTPMKWGKLSKEEIELKSCILDPEANAVVLCDYGQINFIPGQPIEVRRHKRIKILKKTGIEEQADIDIPYYNSDGMERVFDVEAQTINVTPDSKINIIKVEKDKIFEVDYKENWKTKRFSFPVVEEGSIIEYSYKLQSKYYLSPEEWKFQCEIPTLHSEYRARIEEGLDVRYFLVGRQLSNVYGGKSINTFVLGYLPAIKEEPYCPNPQDYVERVFFQLAGYDTYKEGRGIERVITMTSWEKLAVELMDNDAFSGYLRKKGAAREFLENNIPGLAGLNNREKVTALHKLVSNYFRWDGKYTLNIGKSFKELVESKTGNGAEINMFLTSLMLAADLDASPALSSTKNHGIPGRDYPVINQYNHILCHVKMFEDDILLDATDPFRTSDLLGTDMLNPNVFVVNIKSPRLIDPKQTTFSKINTTVIVDTIADDYLGLQTLLSATGYTAIDFRKKIQMSDKPDKVMDEVLFPDYNGIKSDSCIVENQNEIGSPLKIKYFYRMEKDDGGTEGYIYIKPLMGLQFPKLIAEKRTLPIDFYYKREYNQTFILKIPDDYELIDMPKVQNFSLPDKAANFVLNVKNENNMLSFKLVYKLNTTFYYPSDYESVKAFYNLIEKATQSNVVLKKK